MYHNTLKNSSSHNCEITEMTTDRYLNPNDISLPPGYKIEVFIQGLDAPSCIAFDQSGNLYIGESGYITKEPSILKYNGQFSRITDGFYPPLTGICIHNEDIFVSHHCTVTVIKKDGTRKNIISGLPSQGDHWNSNVTIGMDNKLYFGQGTATNSGVVGNDNHWVSDCPYLCDFPGSYVMLNGQNYKTENIFSQVHEYVETGAFSPYGIPNIPYETRKGILKASGSILRANLDGSGLELVAWGLRFPTYVKFDHSNNLYAANQGYEVRGSRPIANAPDEFQLIKQGVWYGFPDYAGGEPVTLDRFRPDGKHQPQFLLVNHPNTPPHPYAIFPPHSYITGFDFNYNEDFGPIGDVYIAEFGMGGRLPNQDVSPYSGRGHKVSKIDMDTRGITTFAMNKAGFSSSITRGGGLSRPVDIAFSPEGDMYVVDMGINSISNYSYYYPNTGVVWKISRI
ncbi:PQQ-dependent sugar dehydrogenase [Variimorphobacter saccharofermentans]|nr:hypothetical protein [Variimorphobacter saccharofermentans]